MGESEMTEDSDDIYMSDPRAKTIEGFIAGLVILAGHMPKGDKQSYAFGAEHDVIHIWGDISLETIPEDSLDGKALLSLGFHTDAELDQWQYFT